jgi:hypothetical protein
VLNLAESFKIRKSYLLSVTEAGHHEFPFSFNAQSQSFVVTVELSTELT